MGRKEAFMLFKSLMTTAVFVATVGGAGATDITGAGATFPFPIYAKWADAYKKETNIGLNYQSIGSGGGIKQIKAKTVTFGASDQPLKLAELDADGLVQWPQIMGAIVPVVNLEGVKPGELTLDGATLANIFLGKITKWDDPAIAKLNPNAKLPSEAIAVVHRSDGSGTTFNFTDYLSKVSDDWKTNVGENTSVQWPVGIGSKGNEGVAAGDRLCRIRLLQAEQYDLCQHGEPRRQDGLAEHRHFPGGRGQRRLGACARLLPDSDQRTGGRFLADHRLQFHSHA
jgi:phosphate transport system substrate-binding protein